MLCPVAPGSVVAGAVGWPVALTTTASVPRPGVGSIGMLGVPGTEVSGTGVFSGSPFMMHAAVIVINNIKSPKNFSCFTSRLSFLGVY